MSDGRAVTLSGTFVHSVARSGGAALRIEVSLPFGYEITTSGYPVVYLIDGYWYFPIVSQAVRLIGMDKEMPPVIVVGLGYESVGLGPADEERRIGRLRCRDLTPTHDPREWWRIAGTEGGESGHAEEFVRILESTIKPLIRACYRTLDDETLAGHSFGGLFALHVLFKHTELFDRYVAGSPALWWHDDMMFRCEADYAALHSDLAKALFISIGALEESGSGAACRMVGNVRLLTERLRSRQYPALKWESVVLENETHSTGAAATFIKGLMSVFRS